MNKSLVLAFALMGSFGIGFAFNSMVNNKLQVQSEVKKVTGIGGIFFKCKDPKKMTAWYHQHLGLFTNPYGATFSWFEGADSTKKAQTQWTPFSDKTKYFEPSTKDFMINYRVDNLELLIKQLKQEGVAITDTMESYDYGKFIHILDVEGNKVELWEPID